MIGTRRSAVAEKPRDAQYHLKNVQVSSIWGLQCVAMS